MRTISELPRPDAPNLPAAGASDRSRRGAGLRLPVPGVNLGRRAGHPADAGLIPARTDQNRCAQSRIPMDMIFQGRSIRLFQASQHRATISS